MKVVHFITSIDKSGGGTTAYLQLLAGELKQSTELVIASSASPQPVDLKEVRVVYFDLSVRRVFQVKKEFRTFLQKEKPDVVHVNGIWQPQTWWFQQAAQSLGISVILSPHGMLEPYILNRHPLKKKMALWLYQHKAIKRADALHATAASELEQFRRLGYTQSAFIVPNGIELSQVQPKTEWRPVQHILFMSRVHPKKGIELLIEAIAEIKRPDIRVTIAGEGEAGYVESLKQLTREKQVEQQFDFVGGVYGEVKWKLYQQADLFVLPTYSENFGIVVAEALATGLPVITTKGAPWKELEDYKCGWWIDLSIKNIQTAINQALQLSTEELQLMGGKGKKLVNNKYDIKAISFQISRLYQSILD